jgi:hypothetical protein
MNPKLMIFLPTLEVINSTITWTHRLKTSFKSIIIHEFLHLCGDVESPTRKIVDGVIRQVEEIGDHFVHFDNCWRHAKRDLEKSALPA